MKTDITDTVLSLLGAGAVASRGPCLTRKGNPAVNNPGPAPFCHDASRWSASWLDLGVSPSLAAARPPSSGGGSDACRNGERICSHVTARRSRQLLKASPGRVL